jgi:hypothetical protein
VCENDKDLVSFYLFKYFQEILLCNCVSLKSGLGVYLGQIRVPKKPPVEGHFLQSRYSEDKISCFNEMENNSLEITANVSDLY